MKKLLVLALTALMVLSLAAVSMAAVTVGGEFQLRYDFSKNDTVSPSANKYDATEDVTKGQDWIRGDLKFTADVADNMQAFIKLRNEPGFGATAKDKGFRFEEAWFKATSEMVDWQFGFFGFGFGGKKDIIDLYTRDLKAESGISANIKAAEGVTVGIYYALDGTPVDATKTTLGASYSILQGTTGDIAQGDGAYGLKLGYDTDTFGVGLGFMDYAAKTNDLKNAGKAANLYDAGLALNGYYKMDAVTFYLIYDSIKCNGMVTFDDNGNQKDFGATLTNQLIGVMYDSADVPFYGRFEYDLVKQDDYFRFVARLAGNKDWKDAGMNPWGIRLGYKVNGNVKVEYNRKQQVYVQSTDLGDNNIRLIVSF